jgi:hypothetical protein
MNRRSPVSFRGAAVRFGGCTAVSLGRAATVCLGTTVHLCTGATVHLCTGATVHLCTGATVHLGASAVLLRAAAVRWLGRVSADASVCGHAGRWRDVATAWGSNGTVADRPGARGYIPDVSRYHSYGRRHRVERLPSPDVDVR